jgi:hypothetical protein
VQDQPNELESRVRRLDDTVERLTSDVASLKLEVATLISALRESQFHHARRATPPPIAIEPPSRPTLAPAAIVVLLATGLLSWQLISTPHREPVVQANRNAAIPSPLEPAAPPAAPAIDMATEPPLTPLVSHTIYRGTLTVKADRPGARVFVNRKDVGTAPVRVRNLRAGAHLVWVESDGYRRWTRVITVPAERVTHVSADLEPVVED